MRRCRRVAEGQAWPDDFPLVSERRRQDINSGLSFSTVHAMTSSSKNTAREGYDLESMMISRKSVPTIPSILRNLVALLCFLRRATNSGTCRAPVRLGVDLVANEFNVVQKSLVDTRMGSE